MSAIKRVKKFIDFKGLAVSVFEKNISMSNNSIQTAIKRNSGMKDDVLNKILNFYEEINPLWLLTGEGEMLKEESANEDSVPYVPSKNKNEVVYYPEITVTNSDIAFYDNIIEGNTTKIMINSPALEGSQFALPNYGDSNDPAIKSGDIVGYRKIMFSSPESLDLNRIYLIITTNGQRYNKKLQHCKEDSKKFWAISINSKKYPPHTILKKDIIELYEIVGVERRFGL